MGKRAHYRSKEDSIQSIGDSRDTHELKLGINANPFKRSKKSIKIRKPMSKNPDKVDKLAREIDMEYQDEDLVLQYLSIMTPHPDESEMLIVVEENKDGGQRLQYKAETGNTHSVESPEEVYLERQDGSKLPPNSIYDIHSHPDFSTHSIADMQIFLDYPSIMSSLMITPEKIDGGSNIVFIIEREPGKEIMDVDADEFKKSWVKTEQKAKKEIRSSDEDEWFSNRNLIVASKGNKKIAAQLKNLELLGDQYNFTVDAATKSDILTTLRV